MSSQSASLLPHTENSKIAKKQRKMAENILYDIQVRHNALGNGLCIHLDQHNTASYPAETRSRGINITSGRRADWRVLSRQSPKIVVVVVVKGLYGKKTGRLFKVAQVVDGTPALFFSFFFSFFSNNHPPCRPRPSEACVRWRDWRSRFLLRSSLSRAIAPPRLGRSPPP